MPRMGGIELMRNIRERFEKGQLLQFKDSFFVLSTAQGKIPFKHTMLEGFNNISKFIECIN